MTPFLKNVRFLFFICALASLPLSASVLKQYYQAGNEINNLRLLSQSAANDHVDVYHFHFDSLRWPSADDHWFHRINVYKPNVIAGKQSILFVHGGTNRPKNDEHRPDAYDNPLISQGLAMMAQRLATLIIEVKDTPNQFLFFEPGQPVKEDCLAAYTWLQSLLGKGDFWPVHLPMAKSTSLALTALERYAGETGAWQNPEYYLITGLSKRGWSSWLTLLADHRINAILPGVIGILDSNNTLLHIRQSLEKWPEAFYPYVANGIADTIGTEPFTQLMATLDPWQYRELPEYQGRLSLPKYLLIASSDQFFAPDSLNHILNEMPGETYIRILPNEHHYLSFKDYLESTSAFYLSLTGKLALPKVNWVHQYSKLHEVSSNQMPIKATLWVAYNPDKRDFRKPLGINYQAIPITGQVESGIWRASIELLTEPAGFRSHFVELKYPAGITLTTPAFVYPNIYPASLY